MRSRQEIERLARSKQKNKLILILLCAFLALSVVTALLVLLLPEKEPESPVKQPPEIIEGEAIYKNYAIAYPTMEERQIQAITIRNDKSTYSLKRYEPFNNAFVLYYDDEDGKTQIYYPDIVEADSSFDYESLYAIEQDDGYNRIYKLTYLFVALELPYFDERIPMAPEGTERDFQLRQFGLDEPNTITFEYKKDDGEVVKRKIQIGDKNVTGLGYYFTVDDRAYIYSSTANYYDYAMLGFESYIKSTLVAAGLKEDSSYEPYLTTNFKQWVNQTYSEAGMTIPEDSTAVLFASMHVPLESTLDTEVNDDTRDGYTKESYSLIEFDLKKHKNDAEYASLVKAIKNSKLGIFYDSKEGIGSPDDQLTVTLTANSKTIDFAGKDSINYRYEIFEIESILSDSEDVTALGTPVGDSGKIKVAYYLYVDGQKVSNIPYHAVIDLENDGLPESSVNALRASSIGELGESERINMSIDYTKENAAEINIKCVIVEIISAYNQKYEEVEKVEADSIVVYRYKFIIDGKDQETYYTAALNLATDTTENGRIIKEKLIGKGPSKNLSIQAYGETEYCELVYDFITYNVARIDYFVTSEMISAFRFQNNSERDPFYGESLYENTMENEYRLYGLNSSACEEVVKVLGGIGETTGQTDGLVGIETVAVGITPEIKQKYGLYAHTVYFELPRGIIVVESGKDDVIDDYTWYETLGFTLYISEEDPVTKTRYVGSDMYGIVAKVRSELLVFLDYDFVNFWARRNLMLVDIDNLASLDVDFMMEDIVGSYDFDLSHNNLYLTGDGNGTFTEPESYSDIFNFIRVYVSAECHCTGECKCTDNHMLTELKKLWAQGGTDIKRMTLAQLYKLYFEGSEDSAVSDGMPYIGYDTAGTAYFKEILEMLYFTQYAGNLTEAEQADAEENSEMLMRISLKLRSTPSQTASKNLYVYEFYRYDDRRVMVKLYQTDSEGNAVTEAVSDFYVSTLALKKIVSNFYALLNAEDFDTEEAYPSLK